MSAKLRKTDAYGVCKWCTDEAEKKSKGKKKNHAPVCNTYLPGLCICEICGKPYNRHEG